MSADKNRLQRVFWQLLLINFLLTLGFFVGRTAKDALFIGALGAERLPWAFIINAILIFLIGGWLALWQNRYSLRKVMYLAWGFSILGTAIFSAIFYFGLQHGLGITAYFAFFSFFEIPYLALIGIFWNFAGEYFNIRQQDKYFPKITIGSHLGTVAAGLLAVFATPLIGASGLILAWCISLVLCLVLIIFMWQRWAPGKVEVAALDVNDVNRNEAPVAEGLSAGLKALGKYRYASLFAAITFCTFFVMSIFDYSLADTARRSLSIDPDLLAVYFGYIIIGFGVVAFFLQLGVVPKLLSKWGVPKINLIAPALLTSGGFILLIMYDFIPAAFARGLFLINEFVFNQTLLPFIYGAIPERDRNQVRSTTEGSVTNFAMAAAGVFLFLPATFSGFQNHWLGMAAFFVAAAMLLFSWMLGKEYNEMLRKADFEDIIGKSLEQHQNPRDEILKRDLMSNTNANILLALHIIREHRRDALFDAVLTFADDQRPDVRLRALETLLSLMHTNEHFEKILQVVSYREASSSKIRFKKKEAGTLALIEQMYCRAGRANQLTGDFEYLVLDATLEPALRSLAFAAILKTGAANDVVEKALKSALESGEIRDNTMAAKVLGALPFRRDYFEKLKTWVMRAEKDAAQLKLISLESIASLGTQSPIAAEEALSIVLEKLKNDDSPEQACAAGARIVASHPFLIRKIEEAWVREEQSITSFREAMGGILQNLPHLLMLSKAREADELLLKMFRDAEHQTSREALKILSKRVEEEGRHHVYAFDNIWKHIRVDFVERLCLYGKLRQELKEQIVCQDALTYRIEDIFCQYGRFLEITYQIPENKDLLRRDITRLFSKNVLLRDKALKSLEIILSRQRDVYLEVSNLLDALDFQKSPTEQNWFLIKLAEQRGYEWCGSALEIVEKRLFTLKKDFWLQTILTIGDSLLSESSLAEAKTDDILEKMAKALRGLKGSPVFENIPYELLVNLVFRGKPRELPIGARLLLEGQARQGLWIVTDGDTALLRANPADETVLSPAIWGEHFALSGEACGIGVKAVSETIKAVFIEQEAFEAWLFKFPEASKQISVNLIKLIEGLNEEEKKQHAKFGEAAEVLNHLEKLEDTIKEIIPRRVVKETQKRYLVEPFDIEKIERKYITSVKELKQYYLVVAQDREVRMRSIDGKEFEMTLKDSSHREVTVSVQQELYDELESMRTGIIIHKKRYRFDPTFWEGWSLDVYDDASSLGGMWIAEIELSDESSPAPALPKWVEFIDDISENEDFDNRNLALFGVPDILNKYK